VKLLVVIQTLLIFKEGIVLFIDNFFKNKLFMLLKLIHNKYLKVTKSKLYQEFSQEEKSGSFFKTIEAGNSFKQ